MRIYFLMATYNKLYSSGGSIAKAIVERLSKKADVTVITVGDKRESISDKTIRMEVFPLGMDYKRALLYTRIGLQEDYLSRWGDNVINYIINDEKATKEDILLCTTVGELGMLHVGSTIKNMCGSKFYIHFHDPIKHAKVDGKKYGQYPLPYASREKYEEEYVLNADKIFTCCETFRACLVQKYPLIESKTKNFSFGWYSLIKQKENSLNKKSIKPYKVVYGGIFNWPQGPEILGQALGGERDFEIEYIGAWGKYKPVIRQSYFNVKRIERMQKEDYIEYLTENVDIGFLSLSRDYFKACVPAKLYEYINAGIPILAALPPGEARDIVNRNGYGVAVDYDERALRQAAYEIINNYDEYRYSVLRDKEKWYFDIRMEGFFKEVLN